MGNLKGKQSENKYVIIRIGGCDWHIDRCMFPSKGKLKTEKKQKI